MKIASVLGILLALIAPPLSSRAQSRDDVKMVVVLTRHGVRSVTHPAELQKYAAETWPKWEVAGGELTPHGASLMQGFGGAYRAVYREHVAALAPSGCPGSGSVFIWADVDHRTVDTGKALAGGFAPGCNIPVQHYMGTGDDPFFDPLPSLGTANKATAQAAVSGAVGGDLSALTTAYASTFASIEDVLGCKAAATNCTPITSGPSSIDTGGDGGLAGINGPIDVGADIAEAMLLEYTDGWPQVGWGRVDRARLLEIMPMHVLAKQLEKTRYAAQLHSSNILLHVLQTLQQGALGTKVAGTKVPLSAHFVFLVGHDTQLAEFSSLLGLSWLVPGDVMNDTPPGGALVFELHAPHGGSPFVRTFFAQQTLDDMRAGRGDRPKAVPVYVPGCPGLDCPLARFASVVNGAIDPKFTAPWK